MAAELTPEQSAALSRLLSGLDPDTLAKVPELNKGELTLLAQRSKQELEETRIGGRLARGREDVRNTLLLERARARLTERPVTQGRALIQRLIASGDADVQRILAQGPTERTLLARATLRAMPQATGGPDLADRVGKAIDAQASREASRLSQVIGSDLARKGRQLPQEAEALIEQAIKEGGTGTLKKQPFRAVREQISRIADVRQAFTGAAGPSIKFPPEFDPVKSTVAEAATAGKGAKFSRGLKGAGIGGAVALAIPLLLKLISGGGKQDEGQRALLMQQLLGGQGQQGGVGTGKTLIDVNRLLSIIKNIQAMSGLQGQPQVAARLV